MKATLSIPPRVKEELRNLPIGNRRAIVKMLRLLAEFPLMAQSAGMIDAPNVRRAVVGQYLVYYRYNSQQGIVRVIMVRHGRQRPVEADELTE